MVAKIYATFTAAFKALILLVNGKSISSIRHFLAKSAAFKALSLLENHVVPWMSHLQYLAHTSAEHIDPNKV